MTVARNDVSVMNGDGNDRWNEYERDDTYESEPAASEAPEPA